MTLKPKNYKYRRTNGTSLTGGKEMGYIYAELELTNEDDLAFNRRGMLPEEQIQRVTCRALVDSGAWDLVINEEIQSRLNLPFIGRESVTLADETWLDVESSVADCVSCFESSFLQDTIIITTASIKKEENLNVFIKVF